MPSATIEDYLKHIFLCASPGSAQLVPMGRVAEALGVSPGTATTMVKSMAEAGYLVYQPRVGVTLTPTGQSLALQILRRHRIVEVFLVETLGLNWSEVHTEAERLEHAISTRVLDALDTYLGHPTHDPHGAPIPTANGDYASPRLHNLTECPLNKMLEIARITSEGPAFLQFIEEHDLQPGQRVRVEQRCPAADALTLRKADGSTLTLGSNAAKSILVR